MEHASEIDPANWKPAEEAVLCFLRDKAKGRVLLIHKKRGLGAGLINAPGGRIDKGETPEVTARREVFEEVGMTVVNPQLAGTLYFQFTNGHSIKGYVFISDDWSGTPKETPEADPFWCQEDEIPYERMWSDDSWWIPHMFAGRLFRGRFIFDDLKMLSMSLDLDQSVNDIQGIPRMMDACQRVEKGI